MNNELKPCPFCGSNKAAGHPEYGAHGAWIACLDCGLETPTKTGVNMSDAFEYWNTRALCPKTLESAAKAICLSENDELCLDAPCMSCSFHAKAALESSQAIRNHKGEA